MNSRRLHTTVNVIALLFVAGIAFSVSFVAIRGYAIREGWAPWLSSAAPMLVDSLTVLGASLVLARAHDGDRGIYGWCLIVGASVVSLTVNVAHARPTLAAQLLAALPPVSLLASVEAVMSEARRSTRQSQHARQGPGRQKAPSEQRVQVGGKRTRAASIYRALQPDERATITTRAFALRAGVSASYGARVLRALRGGTDQTGQEAEEAAQETEDAAQLSRAIGNGSRPAMFGRTAAAPKSDR